MRIAFPAGHAELPPVLWDELQEDFDAEVQKIYRNCVMEAWKQMGSGEPGEQQEKRKAYEQKLAKCKDIYTAICVFEKGTNAFEGELKNLFFNK